MTNKHTDFQLVDSIPFCRRGSSENAFSHIMIKKNYLAQSLHKNQLSKEHNHHEVLHGGTHVTNHIFPPETHPEHLIVTKWCSSHKCVLRSSNDSCLLLDDCAHFSIHKTFGWARFQMIKIKDHEIRMEGESAGLRVPKDPGAPPCTHFQSKSTSFPQLHFGWKW